MKNIDISWNKYKCKELKKMARKINSQWNSSVYKASSVDLLMIIKRIYEKEKINETSLFSILYNLQDTKEIFEDNYKAKFEFFLDKIIWLLESIENITLNSQIIEALYNDMIIFFTDKEIIERIFKISDLDYIQKETSNLPKVNIFFEAKNSNKSVADFFEEKFYKTISSKSLDINDFEIDYYISRTTRAFNFIFKRFLFKRLCNISFENDFLNNKKIFNLFEEILTNLVEKKEIYKMILYFYREISVENYPDRWFRDMYDKLGELDREDKGYTGHWEDFSEKDRAIFKKWLLEEKLEKFFTKEVNDPERTKFWKKYINSLDKIDFFQDLNQAIIMEFKNHTVVEFGERNNASYVYSKNDLDLKEIRRKQRLRTLSTWTLKNSNNPIKLKENNKKYRWGHSGRWQEDFKYKLSQLGYK